MNRIPPPSPIREMMAAAPPDAINLAIGEPDFQLPPEIWDDINRRAPEWPHSYSPNAGLPELRTHIAALQPFPVSANNICVTCGAQEALAVIAHALIQPGDAALVPNPGFLAYANLVQMMGGTAVPYQSPIFLHEKLNIDAIARQISPKTKFLFLNSPANPTGYVFSADDLRWLAALCDAHGITIISDEVYSELYFCDEKPRSIREFSDRAIVVSSLSKSVGMTGWRLGWLIAPATEIAALTLVHQYFTTCAPVISQRIATLIFEHYWQPLVEKNRLDVLHRRNLLLNELRQMSGWQSAAPDGGLFVFANIPQIPQIECASRYFLQSAKVITVPGNAFGNRGNGFIRLSFGISTENIRTAVRQMRAALTNPAG